MLEDLFGRVDGDVEAGDARVCGGEVVVVGRPNDDGRHGLEAFFGGGEGGRPCPEVHQVLLLLPSHPLDQRPEPTLRQTILSNLRYKGSKGTTYHG